MKKKVLILSFAIASCLLLIPIVANRLGAGQDTMSIIFWIGPGIIVSQTMTGTKKQKLIKAIITSFSICLIISFLGVLGFVFLPRLLLETNLLPEPFSFWVWHFMAMNLICLFSMYVTQEKNRDS